MGVVGIRLGRTRIGVRMRVVGIRLGRTRIGVRMRVVGIRLRRTRIGVRMRVVGIRLGRTRIRVRMGVPSLPGFWNCKSSGSAGGKGFFLRRISHASGIRIGNTPNKDCRHDEHHTEKGDNIPLHSMSLLSFFGMEAWFSEKIAASLESFGFGLNIYLFA